MNFKQLITGLTLRWATLMLFFPALATELAAQEKQVTISRQSISVRDAINEIESQTGYVIGFRNDDLEASKQAKLPRTQGTAKEILGYLLSDSGQTWETNGDYIVILPAPPAKPVVVETKPAPAKTEAVQGIVIPTEIMRVTLTPEPEPAPYPRGGYAEIGRLNETPRWAVKTNLLFDAALTVSLGAEIRLGCKTTLDVPFTHNSWGRIDDRQWENFLTQPGVRFWTCEAFNGFFWGFHAHYAKYNISGLPSPPFGAAMRDYRYEGHLAGAGVNAGYQWILGKRWAIEAEFGMGYARLWHDKFQCNECGDLISSDVGHYFGPTKVGASLIFIIK